jgi:DNA-binding GntR family transcriptional regulator
MNADALALPPIERVTLNGLAYTRLKRALLSGRIEPGTALTLRQLAKQLGTSMMPVREAITRLSAENALEVLPNRGIVVPHLDHADTEDIWSLRIQLEGDACARAARRARPEQIEQISLLCDAVRAAAKVGDLHGVLECNSDFQFAVYQAAGSPVLLQLIEVLRMKSVPHCTTAIRVLITERPTYYQRSWDYHDRVVAAITEGDAPGARRAKQADLREFRNFVNAVRRRDK